MEVDGWDRGIRAVADRPISSVMRRLAGPAAEELRRRASRLRLALGSGVRGHALQAALSARLDLATFNADGPPEYHSLVSRVCNAYEIGTPQYAQWCNKIDQGPRFHRKQWEHVVILEAAAASNKLRPGNRAIGFGVGTEPLPATFAAHGMQVLATDQPKTTAAHWASSREHSSDVDALAMPAICGSEDFQRLVSFRALDMNQLQPSALGAADLVWSACVVEHLGSPEAGLNFIRKSLQLLNPGGVAVHTTELDLTPGNHTVDYGNCAIYRLADLWELQQQVRSEGYVMELNPYVAMEHPADRFIAPPYSRGREKYHLKLALYSSITTSVAIFISAPDKT